jgi:hypothetical protein
MSPLDEKPLARELSPCDSSRCSARLANATTSTTDAAISLCQNSVIELDTWGQSATLDRARSAAKLYAMTAGAWQPGNVTRH